LTAVKLLCKSPTYYNDRAFGSVISIEALLIFLEELKREVQKEIISSLR